MESFEEIQRPPWPMKVILIGAVLFALLFSLGTALLLAVDSGEPFEWFAALPISMTFIVIYVVMFTSRLRLRIDQYGVAIRFRPFHLQDKVIRPREIVSWRIRPLNAFWEFGGWGIRWGWKKKVGYVWDGKHGIELRLKDGRTIVCSVVDHAGALEALQSLDALLTRA
jgi:hypothetical protein